MKIILFALIVSLSFITSPGQKSDAHPYAVAKPMLSPAVFGEGVVSTPEDDLNAAFSPDGKSVYFTRNFPRNRLGVILVSEFRGGKWGAPKIAPFSGQFTDYDPFFSPDGSKIFFCTNRGSDGKAATNFDIWFVEKTASGWGDAKPAGSPVNSATDEFYPSVASDGTLYFASNRPGGKGSYDIYRAKWTGSAFAEPENLGDAINLPTTELDNYISPDQKFLVFAANSRKDDLGGGSGDLYISFNRDGVWTPARNVGAPINSPAREYCPIGSPDGKYFFFTSFRGDLDKPLERRLSSYSELENLSRGLMNGRGNVFQIDISALGVE
jgi:Tol biopolymer transport system component